MPERESDGAPAAGVEGVTAESPPQWTLGSCIWMLLLWIGLQVVVLNILAAVLLLTHARVLIHMLEPGVYHGGDVTALLDMVKRAVHDGRIMAPVILLVDSSFLGLAYVIWVARRKWRAGEAVALAPSRFRPWIAVPAAVAVGLFLDAVSLLARQPVVSTDLGQWFATPAGALAITVCLVSIVPLTEEAYFRGVLYAAVSRRAGVSPTIVITALVFALLHLTTYGKQWVALAQAFAIGIALGALRARSGSIWPCILAHATFNLIASLEAIGSHLLAG